MIKKFLTICLLLFLTHCAAPGSALLGPAVTGATTKNMAQTSISFGTNQIFKKIHQASKKGKIKVAKIVKKIERLPIYLHKKDSLNIHR